MCGHIDYEFEFYPTVTNLVFNKQFPVSRITSELSADLDAAVSPSSIYAKFHAPPSAIPMWLSAFRSNFPVHCKRFQTAISLTYS